MRNVPENYQPIFGGWRTVVLKIGVTGWDEANRSVKCQRSRRVGCGLTCGVEFQNIKTTNMYVEKSTYEYPTWVIRNTDLDQILKIVPSRYMSLVRHGLLVWLKYVEVVSVFTVES